MVAVSGDGRTVAIIARRDPADDYGRWSLSVPSPPNTENSRRNPRTEARVAPTSLGSCRLPVVLGPNSSRSAERRSRFFSAAERCASAEAALEVIADEVTLPVPPLTAHQVEMVVAEVVADRRQQSSDDGRDDPKRRFVDPTREVVAQHLRGVGQLPRPSPPSVPFASPLLVGVVSQDVQALGE